MENDDYLILATANRHALEAGVGYCVACLGRVTCVHQWIHDREGDTAICPHCGVDAVVPASLIQDEGLVRRRLEILQWWRWDGFGSEPPCALGPQQDWCAELLSEAEVPREGAAGAGA